MQSSWAKTRYQTWIAPNDMNVVYTFHLLFNKKFGAKCYAYLRSPWAQNAEIKYCMWMANLQAICAKYGLETWFSTNDNILVCLLDMQRSGTKAIFENWMERNSVNGVYCFHLSSLITVMAFLCSQLAPFVQIRYFICDWSFYRLSVLNTVWKRDSLQMIIFVNVCSTCSVIELKTRFKTWITRSGSNGVNFFLYLYLITLMAYLSSQWTPNVQINYFTFD
jgi:hypothetical protein